MRSLLTQTFLWTKKWTGGPYGLLAVFMFLFLDASVFPLPTTVVFITVSLIHPSRSYYNALVAVTGMVLGAIVGYMIGHFLWLLPDGSFTQLAHYMLNNIPGFTEANYMNAQNFYIKWSYAILLFSTVLPLPYQVLSITAGAFGFNLSAFTLATFIFQGFRYFLLAWLIVRYGEGVRAIFQKNLKIIALITVLILLIIIIATEIGS
jgi:membrane protein YqaA with SNARE-associated domain